MTEEPQSYVVLDLTNAVVAIAIIVVVLAILFAVAMAVFGPHARARRRMQRGTAKLADRELVTLTAIARPLGTPLIAPLSGVACVADRSRARVLDRAANVAAAPVELEHARFVLETVQGPILVDAERVEVEAVPRRVVPRSPEREAALLARHAIASNADAQFDEIVVRAAAPVTVHGMVVIDSSGIALAERGYRDQPGELRIVAPDRRAVVLAPP